MKKYILSLAILLSMSFSAHASVGYVNIGTVLSATQEGKRAKKKLESFFTKRNKVLKSEGKKLEKAFKNLEKERKVLSEEAFNKKLRVHQLAKVNYDKNIAEAQVDLQKRERDLTVPILKKVEKIVASYSKKNKLEMVLNKEVVLYGGSGKDITSDIIRAYNKKYK